jgi:hypothetical protein
MGSKFARAAVAAWLLGAGAVAGAATEVAVAQTPAPIPAPAPVAPAVNAAPAVTMEGALALAKTLGESFALLSPAGGGRTPLILSGPPVAMPSGDHYVVALPSLSLRGQEQERLDFGSVWLTLKPLADGAYAVTVALPGSAVYLEDGDPMAVATIGEQKISGVWSPALMSFLSMEMSLKDLQIAAIFDDFWFGVGALNFTQDLKAETKPGDGWSGPSALALSDVRFDKGEDALLSIGGLTVETVYTRFRLDKIAELMQMGGSAATAGKEPPPSAIFALLKNLMGGTSSRMRLTDVTAHDPDEKQAVAFDLATLSFGGADFDRDLASLNFGMELKGLSFDPAPTADAALPTAGDIKLSLRNLPIGELLKLGEALANNAAIPGGDPAAAALKAAETAKMTLKLESLGVETAALRAHAEGDATPKQSAAMGAVAKARLTLYGVDNLLNELKPKKNKKPDPATADLVGGLTMLKAMGRPEKGKEGKDGKGGGLSYTFELTPQGTFLVNDADLAPLLEGSK